MKQPSRCPSRRPKTCSLRLRELSHFKSNRLASWQLIVPQEKRKLKRTLKIKRSYMRASLVRAMPSSRTPVLLHAVESLSRMVKLYALPSLTRAPSPSILLQRSHLKLLPFLSKHQSANHISTKNLC